MRRGLAGLILGISLVMASLSWAGFIMTRTALDPSRSERLADQIFENEQLRDVLADRIALGMTAAIPGEIDIPPELILQAANLALDDPSVQQLVRDGIVQTHRNALEGNSQPTTIDATALGSATRAALISLSPELDAVIPAVPPVEVTLPTTGLSFLGKIRNVVKKGTTILGALAFIGALTALVLTTNRPAVLRRVATWAIGASAFWLAVGFGIPWLAARIGPSSGTIVSAIVDVFFGAMITPAIVLALIGAALFGASLIWSSAGDREPRAAVAGGGGQGPAPQRSSQQSPGRQSPGQHSSSQRSPGRQGPGVSSNIRPPSQTPRPGTQTGQVPVQSRPATNPNPAQQPAANNPQQNISRPGSHQQGNQQPASRPIEPDLWAATAPAPQDRAPKSQEWVEGIGYVEPGQDPTAETPPTARS